MREQMQSRRRIKSPVKVRRRHRSWAVALRPIPQENRARRERRKRLTEGWQRELGSERVGADVPAAVEDGAVPLGRAQPEQSAFVHNADGAPRLQLELGLDEGRRARVLVALPAASGQQDSLVSRRTKSPSCTARTWPAWAGRGARGSSRRCRTRDSRSIPGGADR